MRITYQSEVPDFRTFAIKKGLLAFRYCTLPMHSLKFKTQKIIYSYFKQQTATANNKRLNKNNHIWINTSHSPKA